MIKTPVVILAGIVAVTLLSFYLFSADRIVSHFDSAYSFTCINWTEKDTAQKVYDHWKESKVMTREVKIVIAIDYGFMLVYCSSLCFIFALLYKAAREHNKKWKWMLAVVGFIAVGAGTLIDAIQDARIYQLMDTDHGVVPGFRWMTYSKFILLGTGLLLIVVLLLSMIRINATLAAICNYRLWLGELRYTVSQLLKSVWLFFPCILFLLLVIFCFWTRGQGKDIIIAFKENRALALIGDSFYWNYTRAIFFGAIAFWAYVTWYSARIIAYMKKEKQEEPLNEIGKSNNNIKVARAGRTYPEITDAFFENIPRVLGTACFIVLEIAVLQSPIFDLPLSQGISLLLLVELLALNYFVNRWVKLWLSGRPWFRTLFFYTLGAFVLFLLLSCMRRDIYFMLILALLLLLHLVYILYNNLHRADIADSKATNKYDSKFHNTWSGRIMRYFCIPSAEFRYYTWFLRIGVSGIIVYFFAINAIWFARHIGPFPFVIIAFAVLLAFGMSVTAFSVKYKINFHLLLFITALAVGLKENHDVRLVPSKNPGLQRPYLRQYLDAWLQKNDTVPGSPIDMYFVMSNGGASRSGYWTAAVLGKIEDSTLSWSPRQRFSNRVFCLSGTSGGGLGVACYFSMLQAHDSTKAGYTNALHEYLKKDYFTPSFTRLLGPDFFYYVSFLFQANDRAAILEESFEQSASLPDSLLAVPMNRQLSEFPALVNGRVNLPILCINTTRVQDGNPGVVSNIQIDDTVFNRRVDVVKLLNDTCDISMATAAILGARFPYISPAGNIRDNDFVDGGYFDNSGAGVVQELIHGIINIGANARRKNDSLAGKIDRIRFHVLHIVNSPVDSATVNLEPVPPIKNDLFAPVLTILGAYDMQTTVNDQRLKNAITDLGLHRADYARISLYKSTAEWKKDRLTYSHQAEPEYAMNWFMSDTLANRMDKRLYGNDSLSHYIQMLKK